MALRRQGEDEFAVSHQQPSASARWAIVSECLIGIGCFVKVAFAFGYSRLAVGLKPQELIGIVSLFL